ncbi:hypothetical protein CLU79DRAFT_419361 [Phycomyces nitens]|nr:hypothetical protein CLU79DRAFT_419361 [Phycomyces nitens]
MYKNHKDGYSRIMNFDPALSIKDASGRHLSLLNESTYSPKATRPTAEQTIRRKYHCTSPGCHKSFTTSGHLARHNRIHTGEKNFGCLHPGCLSRFSRQDNMMQHYRTHISPRSRRYQRVPPQHSHQTTPPLEWINSRQSQSIYIHKPYSTPKQPIGKLVKPQPIHPVAYEHRPQRALSASSVCSSASSASFPLSPPISHHPSFQNTKIDLLDLTPSRHLSYSHIVNTVG